MRSKRILSLVAAAVLVSACGGGSGSGVSLEDPQSVGSPAPGGGSSSGGGSTGGGSSSGGGSTSGGGNGASGDMSGSATFEVSWEPPLENTDGTALTDLKGYYIYYGTESGVYARKEKVNGVGLTRYVVRNVAVDTYFVAMTAFNKDDAESDYSNELAIMSN